MDVITHLALGVCTGELWLRRKAGKKILILGALVQALPDIDAMPALYLPADRALLIHRGITHSLVFALVAALLLAWIAVSFVRSTGIAFTTLFLFFLFQLMLHDLLDLCNAYGTELLEPFSHRRFSVNLLYVADPLFSLGLIVAALVLLLSNAASASRSKWAWTAILVSGLYLGYAGLNKTIVDNRVSVALKSKKMSPKKYFTTPAPFNSMLWYIVIDADSCYYTGYNSVFDIGTNGMSLEPHLKNYALLGTAPGKYSLQNYKNFAGGYYTISGSGRNLYINILRFGQIQGWRSKNAPFVLSCSLYNQGSASALQKGRLAGWNIKSARLYIKRIAGHE